MATNQNILKEAVDRLVRDLKPEKIYLFGSRAWGGAADDSDYDFMIVIASSPLSSARRAFLAHKSLGGLGISKDILVRTHDEFMKYVNVPASLESLVHRKGQLLYG